MEEQAGLIAKAEASLRAAQLLRDREFYDIAVSRSYYAMFYLAEALLLGEGLAFSKHSAVISTFGQRFAHTEIVPRELHRYLIDAHDARHDADYEIRPNLSEEEANEHLKHAEQFLHAIRRHFSASSNG